MNIIIEKFFGFRLKTWHFNQKCLNCCHWLYPLQVSKYKFYYILIQPLKMRLLSYLTDFLRKFVLFVKKKVLFSSDVIEIFFRVDGRIANTTVLMSAWRFWLVNGCRLIRVYFIGKVSHEQQIVSEFISVGVHNKPGQVRFAIIFYFWDIIFKIQPNIL